MKAVIFGEYLLEFKLFKFLLYINNKIRVSKGRFQNNNCQFVQKNYAFMWCYKIIKDIKVFVQIASSIS